MFLKIYGERNTGTNYLRKVIEENFRCTLIPGTVPKELLLKSRRIVKDSYFLINQKQNLGWKHCSPDINLIKNYSHFSQLKIICLVKNPYSFILSLYKRPYHQIEAKKDSLHSFINSKWRTVGREKMNRINLESPVLLWNYKVKRYFELLENLGLKIEILKYEDLLVDAEDKLTRIAKNFQLEKFSKEFVNYQSSTKNDSKDHDYYKNYYLNEEWRQKLTSKDIESINSFLDFNYVSKLGYNLIVD